MVGKPKGSPKSGGRVAGTPNKTTTEFKEALVNLMNFAAPNMVDWLEQIDDPVKRFDTISKFAEYVLPKQARTEIANADGEAFKTTQELQQSDKELIERALKNLKEPK